jgi:hypothetical protein
MNLSTTHTKNGKREVKKLRGGLCCMEEGKERGWRELFHSSDSSGRYFGELCTRRPITQTVEVLRQEGPGLNHRKKNLRTPWHQKNRPFFQKFKPPPSKVDKIHKIALLHVEDKGASRAKERCQIGHIEKASRWISYRLLEDHGTPEHLQFNFRCRWEVVSHWPYVVIDVVTV